jgi:hypothetical protein
MSEQQTRPGAPQAPQQTGALQQPPKPAARPPAPQQTRPPRADLSRDELRAHLANVESQIKSALRIIASESKGTQQAHSALRADLSSALVRLQADMNGSATDLSAKIDRLGAEVSSLNRQSKFGRVIFLTFGMSLSFALGILVIVAWLLIKEGALQNTAIPVPIEEMFEKNGVPAAAPRTSILDQRPAVPQVSPAPVAPAPAAVPVAPQRLQGAGILPPENVQAPLSPAVEAQQPQVQELPPGLLLLTQPRQ